MASHEKDAAYLPEDPCGAFGPTQWAALGWFVVMIVFGAALTTVLARIDHRFYEGKGYYLNYEAYGKNRHASTSLGSGDVDPRMVSGLAPTREMIGIEDDDPFLRVAPPAAAPEETEAGSAPAPEDPTPGESEQPDAA